MKKIVICLLCLLTFTITGCTSKEDQDAQFERAAKKYYESNMKGIIGVDEIEVGLKTIKESSNLEDYDISLINKCNESSKVIFTIEDDKITSSKIELNCKK